MFTDIQQTHTGKHLKVSLSLSFSFGLAPPDFMLIYFSYLQKIMILMFRSDYRGTVGVDFALKVLELPGNIRVRYYINNSNNNIYIYLFNIITIVSYK